MIFKRGLIVKSPILSLCSLDKYERIVTNGGRNTQRNISFAGYSDQNLLLIYQHERNLFPNLEVQK